MKVLFATTNQAKINKYKNKLEQRNIKVLTINDLNIELSPNESGKNALENAYIKAKAFYDVTNIITIAMDNNLYIDGLPEDMQPGTHVRRINGKELTDDEMIEYYANLIKNNGGKLNAKWVYGMVIYNGHEKKELTWVHKDFYMVDEPSEKRNPGYPLDSISIDIGNNKYFVDMNEIEKKNFNIKSNDDEVIEFIVKNLKIMEEERK